MALNTDEAGNILLSVNDQTRKIAAGDLDLLFKRKYSVPLRTAEGKPVWKDLVVVSGSDVICMVKLQEVLRVPVSDIKSAKPKPKGTLF